jgi:putative ABC transport system substrate-binding protein
MDRRAFIGSFVLGALAVWNVARAQPAPKVYRIGILAHGLSSDFAGPRPRNPAVNALLLGLGELGYVYGEHFVTEPRGSGGEAARFPALAAELVSLHVDVIVAAGGTPCAALKRATATIPIVMAAGGDPVAEGLVQSLAHPGGNFTGLSHQMGETTGKRLELLKELVPGAAPVAVLWDPSIASYWRTADAAAHSRAWKLLSLQIRSAGEIQVAFKKATDARAGSLLVLTGEIEYPHRQRIVEFAAASRLPAMYDLRPFVEAGGLISYGADLNDIWRRAAGFVDKILKGARPADLPIEQPTKFDLIINLKAAKALGLTIPESMRLRADEVIQ